MNRAVFLDRDGVINRAFLRDGKPHPPTHLSELEILPDVPEALNRLKVLGFRLLVITNQPDVARGTQSRQEVEAMNQLLQEKLPLDEIRVCYHDDHNHCACRKPEPGMLLEAARDLNLDLASSFMVGDRWRDMEAGKRAGCITIFIDRGYSESLRVDCNVKVKSLAEASEWICEFVTDFKEEQ